VQLERVLSVLAKIAANLDMYRNFFAHRQQNNREGAHAWCDKKNQRKPASILLLITGLESSIPNMGTCDREKPFLLANNL